MTRKDREARAAAAERRLEEPKPDGALGVPDGTGGSWSSDNPHRPLPSSSGRALEILSQRDDGWLRLIPSRDGSPCYLKWKFTSGKHAGHYVMSVAPWYERDKLFNILMAKLRKIDDGNLEDRAWDHLYEHPKGGK